MTATTSTRPALTNVRPSLLRTAAIGGLLGGLVLFTIMASYNAAQGMGFWAILNSCFAAFVYKNAGMTSMSPMHEATMPGHPAMPGHAMMMGHEPVLASHVVVGGLLHLVMSAGAGAAFAVALALLIRGGLAKLASALFYVLGGAAGGALLYLIMMEVVAPNLNRTIVEFTARGPFFLAHLAFGATVAGYTYWRTIGAQPDPRTGFAGRYAAA